MQACQYVGLFVGLSLVSACDARPLFQRFSEPNGGNCMSSGMACTDGQICNTATEVCEPTFELTSLTPDLASSAGGTRVEISGRNLRPDLVVRFGSGASSAATEVTFIDETRLTVTVPPNVNSTWNVPITLEVPGQSHSKSGLFSYFAETPTFVAEALSAIPTGQGVAVGDFNNDMRPDAVFFANRSLDSTLSTMLGNAAGSLTGGPTLLLSSQTLVMLALHDVNRDGFVDILCGSIKGLNVLLNNRQGGFSASQFVPTDLSIPDPTVQSVVVADFTQDGLPDVVVVNQNANSVTLLRGNGDGTFATPMTLESGTTPAAVLSGDFDNNQRPDLLTLSTTTPVQVRLADPQGNLPASSAPSVSGCDPIQGNLADLNRDGRGDIVVQCRDNSVRVLLSNQAPFYDEAALQS